MTPTFSAWFKSLKDKKSAARIMARLYRVEHGNFGDHKAINSDLWELRFFFAGGYRVYYTIKDQEIVLLLQGGDKSSQSTDIKKANAQLGMLLEVK